MAIARGKPEWQQVQPIGDGRERKLVHHVCGYPLWSEVVQQFGGWGQGETLVSEGDRVVVNYRSAVQGSLPTITHLCPGCGKPLLLWWNSEK